MHSVLIIGAGKIGSLVATLLGMADDYQVHIADIESKVGGINTISNKVSKLNKFIIDILQQDADSMLIDYIKVNHVTSIISCLPYYCTLKIAEIAKRCELDYFDLTEDTLVADKIRSLGLNASKAFVSQCGLAPGFISIVASNLIQRFDQVDTVLMRVGALPVYPNNALKYSLSWSTDGLINEYGNTCFALVNGEEALLQPLEGVESIQIDGLLYEAFNTSGGLGSLTETYSGKMNTMNYKTIRYPGHCQKMHFLMYGLKLNEDRETLKRILERAISKTTQDVVIIYVSVEGYRQDELIEETYVKKIYPKMIAGKLWSSIQVTTAASMCAVIDIVLKDPEHYKGVVLQESIPLNTFLSNRFGEYYQ